jgi:hypothetical protein
MFCNLCARDAGSIHMTIDLCGIISIVQYQPFTTIHSAV